MSYPQARRSDQVDVRHGVQVPDPYRWLEDPFSAETTAWVDAQNALTRASLDGPRRDALIDRLRALFNYARLTSPMRRGSRRFFQWNGGLMNQAMLYVQDDHDAAPRVLIDPNALSDDGTAALTAVFPSDDGALVAYGISHAGSDRQEFFVRDAAIGLDTEDRLLWIKFASLAWTPDDTGFYYLRFPEPGSVPPEDEQYFGRIFFHHLGTLQDDDELVFAHPEREVVPMVELTRDGALVVITLQRGASDDAEVVVIDRNTGGVRQVFTGFDAAYTFVGDTGDRLLFVTTKGAPMGRLIAVDRISFEVTELVAEAADRMRRAVLTRDAIVIDYLHDASDRLRRFDWEGRPQDEIQLPVIGTIVTLDGRPDADDVLFTLTSFTSPPAGYRVAADRVERLPLVASSQAATAAPAFDPDDFTTTQVWYPSKDGTRISMFLVHRRDVVADGHRPVLLSGYGGFNINRTPQFDPGNLPLLERGGIFALANLRGGGEYGDAWHRAGMLANKQTVFDDFIAAGEYLVNSGYTSPERLAIEGGSNGGLLVGAVMVQRPDLWGAVICRVPVADMLRYHLFTVGRFWIPEYGSADDPEQFHYLLAYSPLHNVREGERYPATLVMTADTDDRVDPGMAKKFAAQLQSAGAGGPFLLRVERKAGHGAGKPVAKLIEEDADILAFLEVFAFGGQDLNS